MKTQKGFASAKITIPKTIEDISTNFLTHIARLNSKDDQICVNKFRINSLKPGLISDINGQVLRIYLDMFPSQPSTIILKANPNDELVYQGIKNSAYRLGQYSLIPLIPNLKFNIREALTYQNLSKKYADFMPCVYYLIINEPKSQIWLFLEDLNGFDLYDKWEDLDAWNDYYVNLALRDLAYIHIRSWNDKQWQREKWLLNSNPVQWNSFVEQSIVANLASHPSFFDQNRKKILRKTLDALDTIWNETRTQPHTIIHGDCTPRNLCFRQTTLGPKLTLYDWALTAYKPPQFDLAKFLLFIYDPYKDLQKIQSCVNTYFSYLPDYIQATMNNKEFYRGFELACLHYVLVYLTVTARYTETKELQWLFQELENRLRFVEQIKWF